MTVGIQKQGYFIGEPSLFIYMGDCNLDCSWCEVDEDDESEQHEEYMLAKDIVSINNTYQIDSIVLTGGEPLLQKTSLVELVNFISNRIKVSVETHGGIEIPKDLLIRDSFFFSLSPKLSNAETEYDEKVFEKNIKTFNQHNFWNFQLKFDIENVEEDIEESKQMMKRVMLPDNCTVIYQPATNGKSLEESMNKLDEMATCYFGNEKRMRYDVRFMPSLDFLTEIEQ